MRVPNEQLIRLDEAAKALAKNNDFQAVMEWIKSERDLRDRENRIPGNENKTSEAAALTTILRTMKYEKETYI